MINDLVRLSPIANQQPAVILAAILVIVHKTKQKKKKKLVKTFNRVIYI